MERQAGGFRGTPGLPSSPGRKIAPKDRPSLSHMKDRDHASVRPDGCYRREGKKALKHRRFRRGRFVVTEKGRARPAGKNGNRPSPSTAQGPCQGPRKIRLCLLKTRGLGKSGIAKKEGVAFVLLSAGRSSENLTSRRQGAARRRQHGRSPVRPREKSPPPGRPPGQLRRRPTMQDERKSRKKHQVRRIENVFRQEATEKKGRRKNSRF